MQKQAKQYPLQKLVQPSHYVDTKALQKWLGVKHELELPSHVILGDQIQLQWLNTVWHLLQQNKPQAYAEQLKLTEGSRVRCFQILYEEEPTPINQWELKNILSRLLCKLGIRYLKSVAKEYQEVFIRNNFAVALWDSKWNYMIFHGKKYRKIDISPHDEHTSMAQSVPIDVHEESVEAAPEAAPEAASPMDVDVQWQYALAMQTEQQLDVHPMYEHQMYDIADDVGDEMGDEEGAASPVAMPIVPDQEMVVQAASVAIPKPQSIQDLVSKLKDELYIRRIFFQLWEFMGQRHYTFQCPNTHPGVQFMVLPQVTTDSTINTNNLQMVAAYYNRHSGTLTPFAHTGDGLDAWAQRLQLGFTSSTVITPHPLYLAAAYTWEQSDHMNGGEVPLHDLDEYGYLAYRFQRGKGQAFVVNSLKVYDYTCPVLFNGEAKDVVTAPKYGMQLADTQVEPIQAYRLQCPFKECVNVPGACQHVIDAIKLGGWADHKMKDYSHLARRLLDATGRRKLHCVNKIIPPFRHPGGTDIEHRLYDKQHRKFHVQEQDVCECCSGSDLSTSGTVNKGHLLARDVVCNVEYDVAYKCNNDLCHDYEVWKPFSGHSIGAIRFNPMKPEHELTFATKRPALFTDVMLLDDMIHTTTSTSTTLAKQWLNQVRNKYCRRKLYQLPDMQKCGLYYNSTGQKLYDARQHINKNVYDYAQLYMQQEAIPQAFGCKKLKRCVEGPSILVFDGSSYGYPAHFDSQQTLYTQNSECADICCVPYKKRSLTHAIPLASQQCLRRLLTPAQAGKQDLYHSNQVEEKQDYDQLLSYINAVQDWQLLAQSIQHLVEDAGTQSKTITKVDPDGRKDDLGKPITWQMTKQVPVIRFNWGSAFKQSLRQCIKQVSCRVLKPMLLREPVLEAMGFQQYTRDHMLNNVISQDLVGHLQANHHAMVTLKKFNPELYNLVQASGNGMGWQRNTTNEWLRWCLIEVGLYYKDLQKQPDGTVKLDQYDDSVPPGERHDICYWADTKPVRSVNRYIVGSVPSVKNYNDKLDNNGDRSCSKHAYITKGLTQGLLLVLCGQCGGCLGYEVMHGGESPRMPFEWIIRHREKAPDYIIYDNACNLATYCMIREPRYFAHTRFVVDRFHRFSHKWCAPAYNANNYEELDDINTQMVEQFWSSLQLNKSTLAHMNKVNYSVVVRMAIHQVLRSRAARMVWDKRLSEDDIDIDIVTGMQGLQIDDQTPVDPAVDVELDMDWGERDDQDAESII